METSQINCRTVQLETQEMHALFKSRALHDTQVIEKDSTTEQVSGVYQEKVLQGKTKHAPKRTPSKLTNPSPTKDARQGKN